MPTHRIYHEDPYRMRFAARVLACRQTDGVWEVELDQTAFCPAVGGQPCDTGKLGGQQVSRVYERDARIMHILDGPAADSVQGEVNWLRRRDHMEHHTAQHLLSQALLRSGGPQTVGFSLDDQTAAIELDAAADPDVLTRAEALGNAVIRENRSVSWRVVTGQEAARLALTAAPPPKGALRVVEIAGFDCTACSGTHVRHTGELGLLRIKSAEQRPGGMRLTFVAGGRALSDYLGVDQTLQRAAALLNSAPAQVPETVERLQQEVGSLRRQVRELRQTLLDQEAAELVEKARRLGTVRVLRLTFRARRLEEICDLAARATRHPGTVVIFGLHGPIPHIVLARSVDVRIDAAAVLQSVLPVIAGTGGGSPMLAHGGGKLPEALSTALDLAVSRVAAQVERN